MAPFHLEPVTGSDVEFYPWGCRGQLGASSPTFPSRSSQGMEIRSPWSSSCHLNHADL